MNKTVEVIALYEFFEYGPQTFKATIDVELKNAADFSLVPLLIEPSDGTIRVAETAPLLATFRGIFKNVTRGHNLNPSLINIDCDHVEIMFDQKPASAVAIITGVDSPRLFTTANTSSIDLVRGNSGGNSGERQQQTSVVTTLSTIDSTTSMPPTISSSILTTIITTITSSSDEAALKNDEYDSRL